MADYALRQCCYHVSLIVRTRPARFVDCSLHSTCKTGCARRSVLLLYAAVSALAWCICCAHACVCQVPADPPAAIRCARHFECDTAVHKRRVGQSTDQCRPTRTVFVQVRAATSLSLLCSLRRRSVPLRVRPQRGVAGPSRAEQSRTGGAGQQTGTSAQERACWGVVC